MRSFVNILRWLVRLVFLASLVLGIALWTGRGYAYLRLHMWLGFIITFALLALVIIGLISRVKPVLPLITLLWAVALPTLGIAQLHLMSGPNHWIIQVIHLILGIGAVGLAEVLAKEIAARGRSTSENCFRDAAVSPVCPSNQNIEKGCCPRQSGIDGTLLSRFMGRSSKVYFTNKPADAAV